VDVALAAVPAPPDEHAVAASPRVAAAASMLPALRLFMAVPSCRETQKWILDIRLPFTVHEADTKYPLLRRAIAAGLPQGPFPRR